MCSSKHCASFPNSEGMEKEEPCHQSNNQCCFLKIKIAAKWTVILTILSRHWSTQCHYGGKKENQTLDLFFSD